MSNFVTGMLAQSVTWQPMTGTTDRDDPLYGDVQTVPARSVAKTRELIGANGEVITIAYQVVTAVQPSLRDLLGGREVVQVTAMVNSGGMTLAYLSLTR